MTVERIIARRYLFGRKKFTFINIISLLATLGILFGVAALITVMSVFNGFNGLVTSILQDFDPHLKVERLPRMNGISADSVAALLRARADVQGMAPFIERKAMAIAGGYSNFVYIKGIDEADLRKVSGVADKIVLGRFDVGSKHGIVLGITLADKLRALARDTLMLISPAGMENILTQYVTPTVLRCPIVGVYESRNKVYDGSYAFVSLGTARTLFRMGGDCTGYDVRLASIDRSVSVAAELREAIGAGWKVSTWEDLHKDLYSVMKIERWSAFILLGVIVVVAVFNIFASLTMLVLEKKRDIGILRTMGMPPSRIQRIFLLEGVWIACLGVGLGLAAGLGLTWLQDTFQLFRLDEAFIIPALPVQVRLSDVLIIVVSTFALCLFAAWYPARRAGTIEIIDAVRWE
jgi:lipoprotein-releasing system permease protein